MSAADVGVGGPSSPGSGVTLVARLQARFHVISTRLRSVVTRLLAQDDGALATWAAAFAKAPQAVPDLPPPPHKRLTRFVVGFVVGAHVALLLVLYWRSSPPPTPPAEITVELVREMPEQPKPEAKDAPKPVPLQPGDEKAKPDGRKSNPASQQGSPEQKAKPEAKKAEEKPKAEEKKSEEKKSEQKAERPAKPAHQRQARHAPLRQEQPQQEAQAQQTPAREQPRPAPDKAQNDPPPAMPAVALPGASDTGTEAVSYQQLVLSQVAKAKKQGRHMGVPGYAGVRFRVGEDGSLEMVKLVVSSGDPNLDIEAEAMIRRAAPFPKPPPGGRRDYGITLVFAAQPSP